MSKPAPIKDRLAAAYKPGIHESVLRNLVFPAEQFPRAHRYATKGGPPGCHRAYVVALKRYGYEVDSRRTIWKTGHGG